MKRKFKDRRKESGISRRKESRRTGELLQGNDYPTRYTGRSVSLLSFLLGLLSPALLSMIRRTSFISEVAGLAVEKRAGLAEEKRAVGQEKREQ